MLESNRHTASWTIGAAVLVAGAIAGCAGAHEPIASTEDALLGEDGTDTSAVESHLSSLTASFALAPTLSPSSVAPTPAQALAAIDGTASSFSPRGCLSITRDDAAQKVTYVFLDCTGPWGLVHVTGTVTASYRTTTVDNAPALALDVVGVGLRVHRATADFKASATVTTTGSTQTMRWNGSLTGTTVRGREFRRVGEWTASWSAGQECISVAGTAEGTVAGRTLATKVSSVARCRAEWPQAGGDVTVRDEASGRYVELTYEGGTRAVYRNRAGQSFEVELACGQ